MANPKWIKILAGSQVALLTLVLLTCSSTQCSSCHQLATSSPTSSNIIVSSFQKFDSFTKYGPGSITMSTAKISRKLSVLKSELNFKYSFDGGQAFRWQQTNEENSWIGVFAHRVWFLSRENDSLVYKVVRSPSTKESENEETLLKHYLRLDESLSELYQDWARADPIFEKAAKKFEGIRILRQDPVEVIFSFICSSNNNIIRIKSMVEKMCKFYGEEIAVIDGVSYYDFPTIDKLADPKVRSVLEEAKFGYRAKFIQQAASKMIELGGLRWISHLQELPYEEAKAELIQLPGVGAKVADCICLMSLDHLQAIPVDVHVFKIATRYYLPHLKAMKSVTDRVYNEVGDHFRSLYGKYAGWSHSILFCADLKAFKDLSDVDNKRKKSKENGDPKKRKNKVETS